jgi:hypothetical protein
LFKGVLKRKYGIKKIQVPSSMRKVGPSNTNELFKSDEALLFITKKGRHPTSYNKDLGRLRSGTELRPLPYFDNTIKRLPDMARRILIGLKVPPLMVKEYYHRARRPENLRHAYLVGIADPTEEIPAGFLFVTGLKKTITKILEGTRSLSIVTHLSKPRMRGFFHSWQQSRAARLKLIVSGYKNCLLGQSCSVIKIQRVRQPCRKPLPAETLMEMCT